MKQRPEFEQVQKTQSGKSTSNTQVGFKPESKE